MPNFSQIGKMKWPTKVRKLQTIEPKRNLLDDFFRELYCLKLLFHTYSGCFVSVASASVFLLFIYFFNSLDSLLPTVPLKTM